MLLKQIDNKYLKIDRDTKKKIKSKPTVLDTQQFRFSFSLSDDCDVVESC